MKHKKVISKVEEIERALKDLKESIKQIPSPVENAVNESLNFAYQKYDKSKVGIAIEILRDAKNALKLGQLSEAESFIDEALEKLQNAKE